MKIGTMTTLFREQLGTGEHISHVEALERIHAAGFRAADLNLCLICAHKTDLHTDAWEASADRIAETAARLDITLSQCHLPFKSKKVKWKTPQDYAYYNEMLFRAIDVASRIGISRGVIHPERCRDIPASDTAAKIRANHAEYDRVVDYALKKNLCLAIENMPAHPKDPDKNYCGGAEELAELVDSYGDSRVGACWDTGHANMQYRDQWEPLHIIGKRLMCTHIHDNFGESDLHLLPYVGTINWERTVTALRDIGYPGDLILECAVNCYTPDSLKDEVGRHSFAVMSALEALW